METKQFVCYKCPKQFSRLDDAIAHLKTHYAVDDAESILSCMKVQISPDLFCTAGFRSFKSLKCHMKANKCVLLCKDVHDNDIEDTRKLECSFNLLTFEESEETPQSCSPTPPDVTQSDNSGSSENGGECLQEMQLFVTRFVDKLAKFNLCHDVVDEILSLSKELVSKTNEINQHMMKENPDERECILTSTNNFVLSHIDAFSTRYKRDLRFKNNQSYVAPKTLHVDTTNIHATVQYVPINKTLTALFRSDQFKAAYFEYNNNHKCVDGIYERFCCGKKFKENRLFQSEKNAIQLQIYFDDFELCSPLKTKSHKVSGLYCTIHNFSPKFTSQSQNMYLISLCDSKVADEYGCNAMLECFVNDVKLLEKQGISIGSNVFLKGSIVQVSFDNLGGNTIFGFTKSFNATYYCRICSCSKELCRKVRHELKEKLRTKEEYNEIIKSSNFKNGKVDLKETLGFVNYCIFNDLNYFHSIDNRSQDRMHDIDEGAMPFVLGHLFDYLSTEGIITLKEIKEKVKSFNYGILDRRNIPSEIFFNKKNLNQNASQMRCLMKHIPFIFVDLLMLTDVKKRSKVHKVWKVVEYILKINQIVNSSIIKEEDLTNLESFVAEFLRCIQRNFGVPLIPKLHFLTHYAETIRQMGSIVKLQMIRGEAKHQTFTRYAKRTNNFMNICKSLSEKHQQHMASNLCAKTYDDQITTGKLSRTLAAHSSIISNFEEYAPLFSVFFEQVNEVIIKDYLIVNSFYFRKGLFVLFSDQIYQIEAILTDSQSFIFFCSHYRVVRFHIFSNSIEIRKSTKPYVLLKFSEIEKKRSYEGKVLNGKIHIIADELDLKTAYKNFTEP